MLDQLDAAAKRYEILMLIIMDLIHDINNNYLHYPKIDVYFDNKYQPPLERLILVFHYYVYQRDYRYHEIIVTMLKALFCVEVNYTFNKMKFDEQTFPY